MDNHTVLDSALFEISLTRTTFRLKINSKGSTETFLAKGLVSVFEDHLASLKDKNLGYKIVLEVPDGRDKSWFTKNTIERFVRFVNTPEILERIISIETEIVQIENSIKEQFAESNKESGNGNSLKQTNGIEPKKASADSASKGENSRIQLVRALEARKRMLQKEQGMAYARAIAAGFDVYYMDDLILFADCFGAARLRQACTKLIDLYQRKQVAGLWSEMELKTMHDASPQSEQPYVGTSENALRISSEELEKQSELNESIQDYANSTSGEIREERSNNTAVGVSGYQKNYPQPSAIPMMPAQYPPHFMQGYPPNVMGPQPLMQGFHGHPYIPGYMGSPYWPQPMGSPHYGLHPGARQQSTDGIPYESADSEEPVGRRSKRKTRSVRTKNKRAGTVVIRNINYITSKKKSSANDSDESEYETEYDSAEKERHERNPRTKEDRAHMKEINSRKQNDGLEDNSGWQVFQKCLLRDGDSSDSENKTGKRDILLSSLQAEADANNSMDVKGNDKTIPQDELVFHTISNPMYVPNDPPPQNVDVHFGMKPVADDSVILSQKQNDVVPSHSEFGWEKGMNFDQASSQKPTHVADQQSNGIPSVDDPSVYLARSSLHDQVDTDWKTQINMDSEIPLIDRENHNSQNAEEIKATECEPDVLMMMPARNPEFHLSNYTHTPSLADDLQAVVEIPREEDQQEKLEAAAKEDAHGKRQASGKVGKATLSKEGARRKSEQTGKISKPARSSTSLEAKVRDEKLRKLKQGLQKTKQEREEEERRRIEERELERQRRIAGRSASNSSKLTPKQKPKQKQMKPILTNTVSLGFQKNRATSQTNLSESPKPVKKISKEAINRLSSIKPTPKPAKNDASQPASSQLEPKRASATSSKAARPKVTPRRDSLHGNPSSVSAKTPKATTMKAGSAKKPNTSDSKAKKSPITEKGHNISSTTKRKSDSETKTEVPTGDEHPDMSSSDSAPQNVRENPTSSPNTIIEETNSAEVIHISETSSALESSDTATNLEPASLPANEEITSPCSIIDQQQPEPYEANNLSSSSFALKRNDCAEFREPPSVPNSNSFEFRTLKHITKTESDIGSEETFTPRFEYSSSPLSVAAGAPTAETSSPPIPITDDVPARAPSTPPPASDVVTVTAEPTQQQRKRWGTTESTARGLRKILMFGRKSRTVVEA